MNQLNMAEFPQPKSSSKYDSLAEQVKALRGKFGSQHRLLQSMLVMLKNMDARLEATKEVLVSLSMVTDDEFSVIVDKKIGLRLKEDNEEIKDGDIAWVSYVGKIDGEAQEYKQENFPIRVGSNSVVFEQALVGRRPNTMGVTYQAEFGSGENKGKTIKFNIDIFKVKTNLKGGDNGDGIGIEGEAELSAEADGSGQQERSNSSNQPLQ